MWYYVMASCMPFNAVYSICVQNALTLCTVQSVETELPEISRKKAKTHCDKLQDNFQHWKVTTNFVIPVL